MRVRIDVGFMKGEKIFRGKKEAQKSRKEKKI